MNWLTFVLGTPARRPAEQTALENAARSTRKAWAEAQRQTRGTAGRA